MLIRYTNMLFFLVIAVYTVCSQKFKDETRELIESIRRQDRDADSGLSG